MKSAWQLLGIAFLVSALITGYTYFTHSTRVSEIANALDAKEREAARGGMLNFASIQIPPLRLLLKNAESERASQSVPLFLVTAGLGIATIVVRRRATGIESLG